MGGGWGEDKKRIHHSGKRNLGRWSLGTPIWRCMFNINISTFFMVNLIIEWILNIHLMHSFLR